MNAVRQPVPVWTGTGDNVMIREEAIGHGLSAIGYQLSAMDYRPSTMD